MLCWLARVTYTCIGPIIRWWWRADIERAHELALNLAESIEGRPWLLNWIERQAKVRDPRLKQTINGIAFDGYVGLAAGFTKDGRGLRLLSALFDFVVVGTVLPESQSGQPRPRIWWCWAKGRPILVNRMGFPSQGANEVIKRLRAYYERFGKMPVPIGISIGPMATTKPEEAVNDLLMVYKVVMEFANHIVDFFEVNISSPNTAYLRNLGTVACFRDFLIQLLEGIAQTNKLNRWTAKPLIFKVSPDMGPGDLQFLLMVCQTCEMGGLRINWLTATNTTISRDNLEGRVVNRQGGISGQYLRSRALATVNEIQATAPQFQLIGCGGVDGVKAARAFRTLGANLLAVYTAFVEQTPFIAREINRAILKELDRSESIKAPENCVADLGTL